MTKTEIRKHIENGTPINVSMLEFNEHVCKDLIDIASDFLLQGCFKLSKDAVAECHRIAQSHQNALKSV